MKWTKEKCWEEALKCKTRSEFYKNSGASTASLKNHWIDDICSHMIEIKKPNGYWTKERCRKEALKYSTKKEFSINSPSSYNRSKKLKIIDDICSHMTIIGNIVKRCIYVYEFPDHSVYIGLTFNINNRHKRHTTSTKKENKSSVYKKINQNFTYELKQLTNYIEIEKAIYFENFYVNEYRKNGWYILNKRKTGGLGGNILKWTKEKCKDESLKYISKSEFYKNSMSAYQSAKRIGILDEICSHMIKKIPEKSYFRTKKISLKTQKDYKEKFKLEKEKCREEALKYNYRNEFQKYSSASYQKSRYNNWLDEICSHMISIKKQNNYWTKERCQEESLKYKNRSEFQHKSGVAYKIAQNMKILNEICSHMIVIRKQWTKEKCREEALKYDTRNKFHEFSSGAYQKSIHNQWLDEICSHMIKKV